MGVQSCDTPCKLWADGGGEAVRCQTWRGVHEMLRWQGDSHLVGPHLCSVGVEGRVVVGLPEEGLDGQQDRSYLVQGGPKGSLM